MPLGLSPVLGLLPLLSSPSLPDPIKISGLRVSAKSADGSLMYEGDVVVRYQGTKIVADRVTVFNEEERGIAEGHVMLIDPDGTAHADRLEFIWKKGVESGSADNVTMRVANTTLRARHAVFHPGEWTLTDVEGTTCLRPTPVYLVTSDKVVVRPGQDLYAHQPRVSLLGHYIGELPSQNLSLTPAVAGLHYPAPAYKVGRGFGATWAGGVQAGKDSVLSFNARAFQQRKPSASLIFTHTYLPLEKATQIVSPRTDFSERFSYGFMDSINVDTPEQERKFLTAARSSLSFGAQGNGAVSDRDRGNRYSKIELVYERGTVAGKYGFLGQARLQEIRREDEGFRTRLNLIGSMELPSHELSPGLSTLARLDSQAFIGATTYGWGRGMAGLTYSPAPWLRLSSAAFISAESGDPELEMDPLYAEGGFLSRADLALGGLKVSFLAKNDRRRGFYDREIAVRQVVGCFEVFYLRRQYPLDSRLGLTLRVQPLIDVFRRRSAPPVTKAP
jgi:hypothetical protein